MKRKLCALLLALGMIVSFAAAAGAAAFADVPGGSWYASGVSLAAEKGIMTGTGETTFSPRRPVSWAQAGQLGAGHHDRRASARAEHRQERPGGGRRRSLVRARARLRKDERPSAARLPGG